MMEKEEFIKKSKELMGVCPLVDYDSVDSKPKLSIFFIMTFVIELLKSHFCHQTECSFPFLILYLETRFELEIG